jgi:hypothetical protein
MAVLKAMLGVERLVVREVVKARGAGRMNPCTAAAERRRMVLKNFIAFVGKMNSKQKAMCLLVWFERRRDGGEWKGLKRGNNAYGVGHHGRKRRGRREKAGGRPHYLVVACYSSMPLNSETALNPNNCGDEVCNVRVFGCFGCVLVVRDARKAGGADDREKCTRQRTETNQVRKGRHCRVTFIRVRAVWWGLVIMDGVCGAWVLLRVAIDEAGG